MFCILENSCVIKKSTDIIHCLAYCQPNILTLNAIELYFKTLYDKFKRKK